MLDDIPGIGPARRRALMRAFDSLEAIKNAKVSDLVEIESMNQKSAESVYNFFHGKTLE